MRVRKLIAILYPFLMGVVFPLILYLVVERDSKAGTIRHAELSPEHPLIVRLAMGRSTALSFMSKPEKVVPGSPSAIEINFVGHDLTLRPLGSRPGNLIIYTKSNRYVILLQVVSDSAYDDAVVINNFSSYSRPIRLFDDTFTIEEIKLKNDASTHESTFMSVVKRGGTSLESDSMPDGISCKTCVSRKLSDRSILLCGRPIETLQCRMGRASITLERHKSGT